MALFKKVLYATLRNAQYPNFLSKEIIKQNN